MLKPLSDATEKGRRKREVDVIKEDFHKGWLVSNLVSTLIGFPVHHKFPRLLGKVVAIFGVFYKVLRVGKNDKLVPSRRNESMQK